MESGERVTPPDAARTRGGTLTATDIECVVLSTAVGLSAALGDAGVERFDAGRPSDLAAWLADGRTRVVLVDPEQLTAVAAMRGRPASRRALFVAVLPGEDRASVEQALRAGADDVATVETLARRLPVLRHRASIVGQHLDRADALLQGLLVADRRATLGDIAVAVAHDLNDPLAVVSLHLDLLGSELLAAGIELDRLEQARDRIVRVDEAVRRVNALVREITAYASAGGSEARTVDVNQAVEQALVVAGGFLAGRARVLRTYGARTPAACDPGRLVQILVDLLVNAGHALPDRTSGNEVTVRTSEDRDSVWVAVEDTGVGIAPDQVSRIFDPTFTTRDGSGLGLWIARSLAEQVGGRVEVRSTPGVGSMFRVALPLAGADADAASAVVPRVLLVEDEAHLRRAIAEALPRAWVVGEAETAEQAHAVLFAEPWDCVVCDVMLPDGSSERLWAAAQERDPELARRFVFVTGGAYTTAARRFVERVPNIVVDKPFRMAELRQIVDGVLATGRTAAGRQA